MRDEVPDTYWQSICRRFKHQKLGLCAAYVVFIFCMAGIFAPLLACSKPLCVYYEGEWYFPLFRYLFYTGFYTKRLDVFYNLLMFTCPAILMVSIFFKKYQRMRTVLLLTLLFAQFFLFAYFSYSMPKDPAADPTLAREWDAARKQRYSEGNSLPDWDSDLRYMTPYAKLNLILNYQQKKNQHVKLRKYAFIYEEQAGFLGKSLSLPTLWNIDLENDQKIIQLQKDNLLTLRKMSNLEELGKEGKADAMAYQTAEAKIRYINQRRSWLERQSDLLRYEVMPLIRPFHWEDDAGGDQSLNQAVPWWELTRINRKDLAAALIFGIRISLMVGIIAVAISLSIGIPVGAIAGFYGGVLDMFVCRLLEIWESMPTFFMLLFVVAITHSKSISIVITIIGVFGWTGFSRYIRGEFFKQRNLPYVEACRSLGFDNAYIMFSHILPNAIPPLLTLLPFAVMGAMTSEAGLSFLGLGEEKSCSWGVLMDEGRSAFSKESYLLWPPAILLTILLIAIALLGDALRDALDPRTYLHNHDQDALIL